ncbi:MAG: flagellar hook-basal body complex protein FliE [Micavibrio sp.]|nr:flagellar hook-basal body complex protein FliE [Micavibrio sp.]|tara:strand:- start:4317 stop:4631 length:315 start_codon:yes stop_codon:yes gene_type:complete
MVDKIIDPTVAARAYNSSSSLPTKNIPTSNTGGVSFQDFMTDAIEQSIDTMKTGETMQARGIAGQADITEVVQAVTDSELTLQTIISLRDRMVSAYQEIMRMPI